MSHTETTTTTTTTMVSSSSTTTTTNNTTLTLEEAMKTVEVVKEQINQYDVQSSKYKTTLRNITAANPNKNDDNNNSVTIEWVKVESGTIEESPKKLLLQLSSPIEEAILYLPPTESTNSNTTTFHSVETGQATLSFTVEWDTESTSVTIEKSETTYMDVSKFTHELLDVLQQSSSALPKQESYETTLRIPILPMATTTTNEENKSSDAEKDALCTVTMNVKYVPSYKDIREELCDCIGKIATQKAVAREELRKASLIVHELSSSSSTTKNTNPKPSAVKSGFLQKDKSTTGSSSTNSDGTTTSPKKPWYANTMEWYNRTMTNTMIIVPVIKNYVFFIAFTVVTHYYGHQLAIPPPV